jgi:hypothetical protein
MATWILICKKLLRIHNTGFNKAVVTHAEQLAGLDWHYVILDEGHKIRNPEAQVGVLLCMLGGGGRCWSRSDLLRLRPYSTRNFTALEHQLPVLDSLARSVNRVPDPYPIGL